MSLSRWARPNITVVQVWAILSAIFICDTTALGYHVSGQLGAITFWCVHGCVSLMAALVGFSRPETDRTPRAIWERTASATQFAVWTLLAGSLGLAVTAMTLLPIRNGKAGTTDDSGATIAGPDFARFKLLHGALIDGRLRVAGAHRIRPLAEVMGGGKVADKFDALSLISKRYGSDLALPLRQALVDKEASVRILAATVMAQQLGVFSRRIGALRALVEAEPECVAHRTALGRAHADYAHSGLLDPDRADAERARARTLLTPSAANDDSRIRGLS